MKRLVKFVATFCSLALISTVLVSFVAKNTAPWNAPAEYKTMVNPVKNDAASQAAGKEAYDKNCKSCHGAKGLGDGPKAKMIETFPGDFSAAEYQNQKDGEHFYKTKFGREEMPAYKGKIEDEDIWNMVNYMRTFKK